MTRSHRCWFITNIWKSDIRFNMTLGTDITFTLSFLSAKSDCVDDSEFCLISRLKSFELNTNGRGLSSDVTVLCFQFHTHRSLQHSKASRYFQTVAELCFSELCSWFMPSKPCPFAHSKIDASAHTQIFITWRYTFRNWGFKTAWSWSWSAL